MIYFIISSFHLFISSRTEGDNIRQIEEKNDDVSNFFITRGQYCLLTFISVYPLFHSV